MARTHRVPAAIAAGLALLATAALPAKAAADKQPLVGPGANFFCSDVVPVDDPPVIVQKGFVVFNQTQNKVSAEVSVIAGPPNTDFAVRLVQASGGDCDTTDAMLHTNGSGNGNAHVQESIVAPNRDVQVFIAWPDPLLGPRYRGAAAYHLN